MSLCSPTVPSPLTLSSEFTQSQGSDGYGTDLIELDMDQVCACVHACVICIVFVAVAGAETHKPGLSPGLSLTSPSAFSVVMFHHSSCPIG